MSNVPARPATRRPSWGFILCLSILAWQGLILMHRDRIPAGYRIEASTGLARSIALRFFYFYHNFGVFPVAAVGVPERLPASVPPEQVLAKVGPSLVNDTNDPVAWGRLGDYGRLYLFEPSVWLGTPVENASVLPFNVLFFVAALIAVLWSFQRAGRLAQGALLVLLVGSSSFQLFETYVNDNIFSLPVSAALLTLALNLPLLGAKPSARVAFLTAATTGVFLATLREVRSEPASLAAALIPLYLLVSGFSLRRRALLALAFVGAFAGSAAAWKGHFAGMRRDAVEFVRSHGGTPLADEFVSHHPIWHPLFCGLGDFGQDKGYAWEDNVGYLYALPLLRKTSYPDLELRDSQFYRALYPNAPYLMKPEGMPEYTAVIRQKVTGDIQADPLWYARILLQRTWRIFTRAAPVQLNLIWLTLTLPLGLWVLLPAATWLAARRKLFELKALALLAPLSLTPFAIYSGQGTTYYQFAHLAALAFVAGSLLADRHSRLSDTRGSGYPR